MGKKEIVPLSWVDDIFCLGLLTEAYWASAQSNLVRVTSLLQNKELNNMYCVMGKKNYYVTHKK